MTGFLSGFRSIGHSVYATVKTHIALARNGVSGCRRANLSMTASRLMRLDQTLIDSKMDTRAELSLTSLTRFHRRLPEYRAYLIQRRKGLLALPLFLRM